MMSRRCFSVSTLLAGLLTCAAGFALDGPKQRPVLTVSGKIGEKNAGETARFDMKMIEALPQHSFTTARPGSTGPSSSPARCCRTCWRR
jgi:hypothetical protein